MKFRVPLVTYVDVEIRDPDVIERITGPAGDEWRSTFYNLRTRDDVLEMLADNYVRNGVEKITQLDGWGDVAPDAASFEVIECELSDIDDVQVVEQ